MKAMLGIRREDKSVWERRAPLAPENVRNLRNNHNLDIIVQPSDIRIFSNSEYRDAGALIDEDLSQCNLILAVKEIPTNLLQRNKNYMYFSHTIKGQPYNMVMLRRLLELECSLLDHEKVTDKDGRRLVLFGYHAGLAGMIDSLWSLGQRLRVEGIQTPFARIKPAHSYENLKDVEEQFSDIACELNRSGIPTSLGPLTVGITGYGNVSQGAQHILDFLQPLVIQPQDLGKSLSAGKLYKIVFKEEHMVKPSHGLEKFELKNYFDYPERYESQFESYLDDLVVLVNCIYWEEKYPTLVTKEGLKKTYEKYEKNDSHPLRVIGDISCDVGGSIQATVKTTQPDNPVFVFDPIKEASIDGFEGSGPVIMAVDNLPCELAYESTVSFGQALEPLIARGAQTDFNMSYDQLDLPAPLKRSLIVHKGEFMPNFEYMNEFIRNREN